MLESVLADVLTRILGQYLKGIDRESVRFGAWSGLIELRTVALRPEALAVLFENLGVALPVTVETGFIGLLRLVVPWKSIGTTPVQIHMHGVTLIAHPVRGDGFDDSQLEIRDRRIKRAKLDTDDAVREASWNVTIERGDISAQTSWSSWLVSDQLRATILDNVQIHLSDIIIRFEDPYSNPESPYVASIHCESLNAVSANQHWKEAFVQHDSDKTTRKLLEIKGFRVDWAPIVQRKPPSTASSSSPTAADGTDSAQRFTSLEHLRKYVSSSSMKSTHSAPSDTKSLIRRVNGSMRLLVRASADIPKEMDFRQQDPAVDIGICFPDVVIDLNDVQYTSLVQTSLYFARIATRGYRPTSPKARWKWAVDQLLPGCTERYTRACRFTALGLEQTRRQRDSYIAYRTSLLKARRTGVEEPKQIGEELERMEDSMSLGEVLAVRDAIDCEIEKVADDWIPKMKSTAPSHMESRGTTTISFWSMLGYSDNSVDKEELPESSGSNNLSIVHSEGDAFARTGLTQTKATGPRPSVLLSLRVAFWLRNAKVRMSERGFPSDPIPRVELNLRDLEIGVMYSSAEDLILEVLLGSVEAWDLQTNSKMVYSRHVASDAVSDGNNIVEDLHAMYPRNVSDAIDTIRSGSNPAKEFLMEEDAYCDDLGDRDHDHDFLDDVEDSLRETTSGGIHETCGRHNTTSRSGKRAQEAAPCPTFRVTEGEFLGSRNNAESQRYVSAVRYTKAPRENGECSNPESSVLEVSIATLEAIIDGPKGSFLWGMKFWQPKGLVQDPILSFLGAAAGARIAELRMELQEALLTDSVPMRVNAVILAPRFVIPNDSANGPAVVVNMGTLGICTSDSSPQVQGLTPSAEPNHVRYSNYVLTLDDLGMYFSPDLSASVSRSLHGKSSDSVFGKGLDLNGLRSKSMAQVERIIRPFSLRFVLQTLRDSGVTQVAHSAAENTAQGDGIAKVRLRGNIPELSLIVTQTALQHILETARKWSEGLKTASMEEEVVSVNSTLSSQGTQNAGEDVVNMFANVLAPNQEVSEGKSTSLALDAVMLAAYSVKVIMQTVSIELREDMESRLVTAVASELRANVIKRGKTDVRADLSLRSWSVTDGSRGSTAAFRRLLYSGTITGSEGVSPPRSVAGDSDMRAGSSGNGNFVSIRYNLDLATNDQHVMFRFLSLHVNCVRETYLRLILFFDRVRKNLSQRRRSQSQRFVQKAKGHADNPLSRRSSRGTEPVISTSTSSKTSFGGITSISSEFDGLTCQLVSSKGVIAVFEMKNSSIDYFRERDGTKNAWGTFGSFSIRDLTASRQEHRSVLSYEINDGLYESARLQDVPGVGGDGDTCQDEWRLTFPSKTGDPFHLIVSFGRVRLLFLSCFYELIQDYVSAFVERARPALASIIEETAAEFGDAEMVMSSASVPSLSSKVFISFDLGEVSFRVPRHSACSSEAVVFNFSQVHVDNIKEQNIGAWYARLDGLQGAVQYMLADGHVISGDTSISSTFLTDCSVEMVIQASRDSSFDTEGDIPRDIVQVTNVHFPGPLRMSLSEAQYSVLYFVLTENMEESVAGDNAAAILEEFHWDGKASISTERQADHDGPENDVSFGDNPTMLDNQGFVVTPSKKYEVVTRIRKMHVSIPALSVEISRGWDVTQDSCKVFGLYMTNITLDLQLSTPPRKVIEFGGTLLSVVDLRPESHPPKRKLVVSVSSLGGTSYSDESTVQEGIVENVSMSYDKEGIERPSIIISLNSLQLEVIPELLRDLSYLAIPGWPFLETSAFAPDFEYIGRTLTLALSKSQVFLLSEASSSDRRALVLTGEFELKMDWMRKTGARAMSLSSNRLEVSSTLNVPILGERHSGSGHDFKDFHAVPFERSYAPLIYPTDSFIEFIGPDVDESGRRVHLSVDAALCIICTSEIPLLRAIMNRLNSFKPSYLSRRQWKQPVSVAAEQEKNTEDLDQKELHRRKARESLTASLSIPVSRFLVTDDRDGRFVPIVEVRLTSFDVHSHGRSMVQIDGRLAMDLFNPKMGCWEPALEPWSVSASMSHGQSGARAFVIRSDERLNVNIAPTTFRAALTVAKALREATAKIDHDDVSTEVTRGSSKREDHDGRAADYRPSVAAFLVRNELGIPIQMSLPGNPRWAPIAINCEVEVGAQSEALVSSSADKKSDSRENAMRCSISIPSFVPHNLSASEPGKHKVTFYPCLDPGASQQALTDVENEGTPMDVLWEVELRKGVPVCVVRSPLRVWNDTKTKLDVAIVSSSKVFSKKLFDRGDEAVTLNPDHYYSVPIHDCTGVIHVRPAILPSTDSDDEPPQLSRPFEWSSALPRTSWLMALAQKSELSERQGQGSTLRRPVSHFPLIECRPVHGDGYGFFFKVIPSTTGHGSNAASSSWLNVSIRAPVVLSNRLPGLLSYRVYQRERTASSSSRFRDDVDGSVLAVGVIENQDEAHLHVSDENQSVRFLSLAFDNGQHRQSERNMTPHMPTMPSYFGPLVSLGGVESGKITSMTPSPAEVPSTRGQMRKQFRANIRSITKGVSHFTFYAGLWLRNRSDTALEVCTRPSFYSAGSAAVLIRECPPVDHPDEYVCLDGAYLSIRLSRGRASASEDVSDHSNWWTTPTVIDELVKPIVVDLPYRSLELDIRPAVGLGSDTFVATIRNSSWIVNSTPSCLQWCHQASLDAQGNCPTRLLQSLLPGQVQGLHWESKTCVRAVHLRLAEEDGRSEWIWSPAIPLDIGFSRELPAKMYRPKTHDQYIARVASKEVAGNSRALVIQQEDRQNPPYRIINLCRERAIAFSQNESKERPWLVRAGKNTRYSWDDPLAHPEQRKLSIRILEKEDLEAGSSRTGLGNPQRSQGMRMPPSTLNIDKVGDRVMVLSDPFEPPVVFNVTVDGATKIITLFDGNMDVDTSAASLSQRLSRKSSKSDSVLVLEWDDINTGSSREHEDGKMAKPSEVLSDYPLVHEDAASELKVSGTDGTGVDAAVFVDSVGISVIDGSPQEIIYLSAKGLLLNYESFEKEQSLALTVESFQVDNQLSKTPYPVLLWVSSQEGKREEAESMGERVSSALSLELHRDLTEDDIFMVKSFRACVRPFNISFEEGLVTHILKFLDDSAVFGERKNVECLQGMDEEGCTFLALLPGKGSEGRPRQKTNTSSSRRIYVHDFKVDASIVRLTSAGSGSAIAKAAGLNASARTVVGLLLNVENCTFVFPELSVQNVFDSLHHFGVLVRTYYITQVDNQRIKLLTSNSLMGNPAALFDAVGTGARDFLMEPGRAKGSADFLASVGRGSKSLFTHTVGGIVESVSSIPRAVSTGLERAVGDNEYLAERERIRGSNLASGSGYRGSTSKNPAQGLATGALSFAHGISSGVTGFIREPVQGARQGGAGGLLKGIGKAFIGGVAKPVAGAMDLVAEPAAGLSRTIADVEGGSGVSTFAVPERPPRAFRGRTARIERYDRRYSVGAWLLRAVGMSSGVVVTGRLVDWVELSDREGRSGADGDMWVWYIVQRYSRSMPGTKKQVREEVRKHGRGPGGDGRQDGKPEKTRVVLVTDREMVVATLDCKLVTFMPLWQEARYEVVGNGAELIVRATVVEGDRVDEGTADSLLQEAQPMIHAPWDVSAGRRRRPGVGSSVVERVGYGSVEARQELEKVIGLVTRSGQEEWVESGGESSRGGVSGGQEMSAGLQWDKEREQEVLKRRSSKGWKMRHWSVTSHMEESGAESEVEKELDTMVRKLSLSGDGSVGTEIWKRRVRVIVVNKVGAGCELRLKGAKLKGGRWEAEAPMAILSLDAKLMELEQVDIGAVGGCMIETGREDAKLRGEVVYGMVEGGAEVGEVVVDVFKQGYGEATVTTRASDGLLVELEGGSGGSGRDGAAVVVSVMRKVGGGRERLPDLGLSEIKVGRGESSDGGGDRGGGGCDQMSDEEKMLQQLVEIGFSVDDAVVALANANGDLVKAVDLLTRSN